MTQLPATMRRMLAPVGYEIHEVADGKAGLDAYRKQRSDVVVVDILVPAPDGLETNRTSPS